MLYRLGIVMSICIALSGVFLAMSGETDARGRGRYPAPTPTRTPTVMPTATATPTFAPTATRTPTQIPPTPTRTPTNVPTATATNTPTPLTATPTATATPSATATPAATSGPCSVPAGKHTWHAPTDHEHGDAPPAWADAFSCASFGHPVVFGGDESTPGELAGINDAMVYVAFKGFYVPPKKGIELYVRLHIHSNPHGRSTVWHSYEVYARETSGVVSFWQGWMPFGKYVTGGGTSAAFGLASQGLKPNIAGADDASENEAWYGGNSEVIPWTWDLLVIIHDPTTYYNRGEDVNPHDMSRWEWTGDKGLRRELSQANYQMGSAKYPDRNVPQVRGWFCATPQGQITTTGSQTCAEGELPQYVMVSQTYTRGMATKTYDCPSCDVLN